MSKAQRLPRAVQEANAAADKWAAENGMAGAPAVAGEPTPAATPVVGSVVLPAQTTVIQQPVQPQPGEDWKTRFVNFKRDADQTISEQRQQISQMQTQIADMQRQQQALIDRLANKEPTPQPAAQSEVTLDMIPEDIREKYDAEWLRDMLQVAKLVGGNNSNGSVSPDLENRLRSVEEVTGSLVTVQKKTRQEMFYDALDDAVPEWEVIGKDVTFDEWLKEALYASVFDEAKDSLDASTIIRILNRFKKETGWTSPAGSRPNLNSQVVPEGGAGGGALPGDLGEGAGVWTESQINDFHTNVTKGRYRNREAEQQRIANEIQLAIQQGRVRPG